MQVERKPDPLFRRGREVEPHCAGLVRRPAGDEPGSGFISLPVGTSAYYLDTCAWSSIAGSPLLSEAFVRYFSVCNRAAVLSIYAVMELSRAEGVCAQVDELLRLAGSSIWIPSFLEDVTAGEVATYPARWAMGWMPVSALSHGCGDGVLSFLSRLPALQKAIAEHRLFGDTSYMSLEQAKRSFPPRNGKTYTPEEAELFAWWNGVEYLGRHFPDFLRQFADDAGRLHVDRLQSLQSRSLFLFFRHYIHGNSPLQSDLMDFAHVSYAPYCSAFVTENNACGVLRHVQQSSLMLSATRVLTIEEMKATIRHCDAAQHVGGTGVSGGPSEAG